MRKKHGILDFEIKEDEKQRGVTSFAGLPLVLETMRAIGVDEYCDKKMRIKMRGRGFKDSEYVEGIVLLLASGGEHFDDIRYLEVDGGLKDLLKKDKFPSAEGLRAYVYKFHSEEGGRKGESYIPEEGENLRKLGGLLDYIVKKVIQVRGREKNATIDIDATIIESEKEEAMMTYKGYKGYQPYIAYYNEMDLVIADEFRDGNVPAAYKVKEFVEKALSKGSDFFEEVYIRGDSALYNNELMEYLENYKKMKVKYEVTAEMNEALKEEIKKIEESEWKPLRTMTEFGPIEQSDKQWAEVCFVSSRNSKKKNSPLRRYIAIRRKDMERDLFEDDEKNEIYEYSCIVTNDWDGTGEERIWHHRGKAGGVEKVVSMVKDCGGDVMPCGRFGANAAWWRFSIITYNILSIIKNYCFGKELDNKNQKNEKETFESEIKEQSKGAFEEDSYSYFINEQLRKARPKTLRFKLFRVAGRIIHHARKCFLFLQNAHPIIKIYMMARKKILYLHRLLLRASP